MPNIICPSPPVQHLTLISVQKIMPYFFTHDRKSRFWIIQALMPQQEIKSTEIFRNRTWNISNLIFLIYHNLLEVLLKRLEDDLKIDSCNFLKTGHFSDAISSKQIRAARSKDCAKRSDRENSPLTVKVAGLK